jgi:ABC-type branched-subunit amino acid transport system ATPase component
VFAVVALAAERLTKVFEDGTVAVDDVTFEVASGEFLVLLGPTGCGKSTILRLIAGLEQPTSGHVLIGGEYADHLSAAERQVSMVFQDYALYPHLSAAENIAFPLRAGHQHQGVDIAASATCWRTRPTTSPAGSGSGWRWPGRSSAGRRSSCWTSHCPTWTPGCGRSCARTSPGWPGGPG